MADLTGVWAKVERAERHAAEVLAVVQDYWSRSPFELRIVDDLEAGVRRQVISEVREEVPLQVSLALGDYVHNLRSALDHLACVTVPVPGKDTAFPVWSEPKGVAVPSAQQFLGSIASKLGKVSPAVQAQVLAIQPWFGGAGELIRSVHYLDIVDKHRLVIPMAVETSGVTLDMEGSFRAMAPDRDFDGFDWEAMKLTIIPEDRGPIVEGFELWNEPLGEEGVYAPAFHFDLGLSEPDPVTKTKLADVIVNLTAAVRKVITDLEPLI